MEMLDRCVRQALGESRIGTPVALRLVAHVIADHGEIERLLHTAVASGCRWLGAPPERITALGGIEAGQVTLQLACRGGKMALISVGLRGIAAPLLEACLVGTHGIASWQPGTLPEALLRGPWSGESLDAPVRQAIAEALKCSETVSVGKPVPSSREPLPAPSRTPAPPEAARRPLRPPFGVLLIAGSATHQEDYARVLAADPRCRLVGLTDDPKVSPRRRELNQRLADDLKIPLLEDLDAALRRDDVHLVSLCAEPERRAPLIRRCAEAGKHLYLDKPLAGSLEEIPALLNAVRQAGVLNHMFSLVHAPASTLAARWLASGELGELKAVHCDLYFAKGHAGTADLDRPRTERPKPVRFETIESKRELFNVGVYPLVFLRWLLGREIVRISALTGNYFFAEHQRQDMEDFATALVELEGGIPASLSVGRTGWRSHPMGGVNKTYLIGSKKVVCVDGFAPRLEIWSDEPPWVEKPAIADDPMAFWKSTPARMGLAPKRAWLLPDEDPLFDVRYFLDCLEQGRPSDLNARVAASAVAAIMAGYESAATGAVVPVPSIGG